MATTTRTFSGFPPGTEVTIEKRVPMPSKWGHEIIHIVLPNGKVRIVFPDEVQE